MRKQFVQKMPMVRQRVGVQLWALAFDGSGDYITFNAPMLPASSDFTLKFYAKLASTMDLSKHREFLRQLGASGVNGLYFYAATSLGSANGHMRIYFDNTELLIGSDIRDDTWHLIELERSGNTFTLYLDGAQDGQGSTSQSIGQGPAIICADNRTIIGYLDDWEVKDGSNNITGSWPMDEGRGGAVHDNTGSNCGIITGATWVRKT